MPDGCVLKGDSIASWFSDCTFAALSGFQVCILGEGDAVWVPSGQVPVCIGIDKGKDFTVALPVLATRGRKRVAPVEAPPFCVGVSICMREADSCKDGNTRRAVSALYGVQLPTLPKAVKDSGEVKAWVAKMARDDDAM